MNCLIVAVIALCVGAFGGYKYGAKVSAEVKAVKTAAKLIA